MKLTDYIEKGKFQVDSRFTLKDAVTAPPVLAKRVITKDSLKSIHIKTCHPLIVKNFGFLAYEWQTSQIKLAAMALFGGIPLLWSLPGVHEIERINNFLIKTGADPDDLRMFSNRYFDFGTSISHDYVTSCIDDDVSQARRLAKGLGLRYGGVYQLAFFAALITADTIRTQDVNQMVGILKRFRKSLESWTQSAKELEEKYKKCPTQTDNPGPRLTWPDVLED
jgi:hypothetical protein